MNCGRMFHRMSVTPLFVRWLASYQVDEPVTSQAR